VGTLLGSSPGEIVPADPGLEGDEFLNRLSLFWVVGFGRPARPKWWTGAGTLEREVFEAIFYALVMCF
jgi:hypothetical protein